MKRHIAQIRSTALIPHQPLLSLQVIIQHREQFAEVSDVAGLGFGVGVQGRPVEDVLEDGTLGGDLVREPLLHEEGFAEGGEGEGVVGLVVLGEDVIRDGAWTGCFFATMSSLSRVCFLFFFMFWEGKGKRRDGAH